MTWLYMPKTPKTPTETLSEPTDEFCNVAGCKTNTHKPVASRALSTNDCKRKLNRRFRLQQHQHPRSRNPNPQKYFSQGGEASSTDGGKHCWDKCPRRKLTGLCSRTEDRPLWRRERWPPWATDSRRSPQWWFWRKRKIYFKIHMEGCPTASVSRAHDSWSQRRGFKPHARCRLRK